MIVAPSVTVEVLLLHERDGCLRFRDVRAALHDGDHPDDIARRLAGLSVCTPGGLLHSTSWRIEQSAVVVTYAALPDPDPAAVSRPVQTDLTSTGGHPLTPSPARVDLETVAAHACRHLALLVATDEQVGQAAVALPDLWQPIRKLTPGVAGALAPVL